MRPYVQQTEPGPCINCRGDGRVPIETYHGLGDEDPDDCEECRVCEGRGRLTARNIRHLGWAQP